MSSDVKSYLLDLQNRICAMIEQADGVVKFQEDRWAHKEGGGGITRAIADGAIIEKGGVNFSHVTGQSLPAAATANRRELANAPFEAMGVSVVIHPRNPYAPTSHFNVRYVKTFETSPQPSPSSQKTFGGEGVSREWFGGGFDLTPYYPFEEDCVHWHQTAKLACEPFGADVYPRYKKWADDYFYLKHRDEHRGIGGLFFDDLSEWGFDRGLAFIKSVGDHYIKAYQPILEHRKHTPYTEAQREFQALRRGRYVEFNLLYDRGTIFGLQTGGRTESILMSLPPVVNWRYSHQAAPGSPEAKLVEDFLKPREWV